MSKLIAALIAATFSLGAFAQNAAPASADKPAASASAADKGTTKKVAKAKKAKKAKKAASAAA